MTIKHTKLPRVIKANQAAEAKLLHLIVKVFNPPKPQIKPGS